MQKRPTSVSQEASRLEYYDTPTIVFHWVTVVLVLGLFGTSLAWNYFVPRSDRVLRQMLESTHVSLGILFAFVIIARIDITQVVPATAGPLRHRVGFAAIGFAVSIVFQPTFRSRQRRLSVS